MALWAAARGTRSQAAAARRPRVTPRTGGHLQAGGGCWLPFRTNTHGRPASTTRSPETPGTPSPTARTLTTAFPHSQSPSDSLCVPPHRCPGHGKPGRDGQSRGPAHSRGQALAQGATASTHGLGKAPRASCRRRQGLCREGSPPPGGTGCLGPALAGAPGRPHTHASAEGKLEAETTTWPAQLWLRAPGRGRAPGAAGGGLTATRTTDGACPGAPQSPSLLGCAPRAGRDGRLPPPGALVGAAGR